MKPTSEIDTMRPRCTAVIGSRGCTNRERVFATLDDLMPSAIVTGGAAGADTLAAEWAELNGVPCEVIRPDYNFHGRHAPHVRNREILRRAAGIIAFWDGKSRGTLRMIAGARRGRLNVHVVTI